MDGLPAGVFKYAPSRLITWLCFFINAYICHQYIHRQVLTKLLMSLLKSKVKDPATSSSSKTITVATVLSKVVEKVVLHCLEAYLYTLVSQFS